MSVCAYCGVNRAVHTDHLISKNAAKRRLAAQMNRERAIYKVPACAPCNLRKYTLLRVPPSHAHLIPELEEITGSLYAIFDGGKLYPDDVEAVEEAG